MQQGSDQSSTLLQVLLRRLWIIILGLILGGALGALVSQQMTQIYQSSVYLLVVPTSPRAEAAVANNYAQAYSKLVTDPAVVEEAVSESEVGVDPWDIKRVVTVEAPPNAPIIQITARSNDPENASTLANALGSGLSSLTEESGRDTGYTADVVEAAVPPVDPALPNWILNIAVGAGTGLLVGGVIALLWDDLRQARKDLLRNYSPRQAWGAWADRLRARRIEKERQRRARQEEEERQRQARELAELERLLKRYNRVQGLHQGEGDRDRSGSSFYERMPDEPRERG